MTSKEAFMTGMAMLGAVFNRSLSKEAIEGYWIALGDVDPVDFASATKEALRECKFMPAPAELLTFVRKHRREQERFEAAIGARHWLEQKEREERQIEAHRPSAEELAALRQPVRALVASLAQEKTLPVETAAEIAERENAARRKIADDLAAWTARNAS